MSVWWCDTYPPNINKRNALMETEIAAMRKAFRRDERVPVRTRVRWDVDFLLETVDLKLNIDDPHQVYWLITFRLRRDPNTERRVNFHSDEVFALKVVYKPNHPYDEPSVYPYRRLRTGDLEPIREGMDYHQFSGGRLCLWDHNKSTEHGWDPATSTAATFALWSVEWIRAYLRAEKTGEFPETA